MLKISLLFKNLQTSRANNSKINRMTLQKKKISSGQTDLIRYKKVFISMRENSFQPHYALSFLRISGSNHTYDTLNKNIIKTEAATQRCS